MKLLVHGSTPTGNQEQALRSEGAANLLSLEVLTLLVQRSTTFSPVRWEPRIYPGALERTSQVRADVRKDLAAFPDDLASDVELCTSELFANAVEYTASSSEGGEVIRAMALPASDRLRVTVTDGGFTATLPAIPELTGTEWFEYERHRGLLMVSAVAIGWGYYPVLEHPTLNLGLVVWADFGVIEGQAPPGLDAYIYTS